MDCKDFDEDSFFNKQSPPLSKKNIFTRGFDLFKQFVEFHSTGLWQTLMIVDTGGESCILVFLKGQEIDFRKILDSYYLWVFTNFYCFEIQISSQIFCKQNFTCEWLTCEKLFISWSEGFIDRQLTYVETKIDF